jgi:hypothetical protein
MDVFISHASEDADFARKLAQALKRSGIRAWDSWSYIPFSGNWLVERGKALEKAEAIIFLLSPASTRSEWVASELGYALTTERFYKRLIPVMVKPTTKFPWVLRSLTIVKGEPSDIAKQIAKQLRAKRIVATNSAA